MSEPTYVIASDRPWNAGMARRLEGPVGAQAVRVGLDHGDDPRGRANHSTCGAGAGIPR